MTHMHTIIENCYASVILDYVDVLYLKDANIYTSSEKKN